MNKYELIKVTGGEASGNYISSVVKLFSFFLNIGRSIGSALNYALNKKVCN